MSLCHRRTLVLFLLALLLTAFPALAVTPAGDALQVNVPSPYWQVSPAVTAVDDGAFLVVWEDMREGIRGRFVDAAGTPLGGELALVANTPFPESGGRVEDYVSHHAPEVLTLPDGDVYLFWTRQTSTLYYSWFSQTNRVHERDVFAQRFNTAGAPVGDAFRVNTTAAGLQDSPQAAALSDGRVAVVWQETPGGSEAVRVELAFVDGGAAVGPDVRVSTAPASVSARPQPLALADGGALVLWVGEDADGTGIFARSFSADGVPSGAPQVVNVDQVGTQLSPTVAAGADGRLLVGWQHRVADTEREYRIRGRFLDAAGAALGGDLQLSAEVAEADGAPALAPLSDGYMLLWLGWSRNIAQWVIGQRLDGDGAAVGAPFQVSTERPQPQHALGRALGGDALFVTWEGLDGITHGISGRSFGLQRRVTLSVQGAGSR